MGQPEGFRERKKRRTRATISRCALQLFARSGFEEVLMTDVAAAADVAPRTVFRYFPDKEELLFSEDDAVLHELCDALRSRPAHEPPALALAHAFAMLATTWTGRRTEGRQRQAVIDASPALLARERLKHVGDERALAEELTQRGVSPGDARLLARTTLACAHEAILDWLHRDDEDPDLVAITWAAFASAARLLDPLLRT